ncbi:hypothetical protein PoMZ_01110 [Pyricularia oryzae]|uniref:Beta-lactamase-related domain-containing protein n=1 Tax=Pyricularia oryzae TaxID=318829 RepID=A0A4P7N7Z0_PYROR|nr:hypothetical protein PoMZ_01110 [Pyricularia oryzae]
MGRQYYAVPVYMLPCLPPRSINVVIPCQARHPKPLRSALGSAEAFGMQTSRGRDLGISDYIIHVLGAWSTRQPYFVEIYRALPFGSKMLIESITPEWWESFLSAPDPNTTSTAGSLTKAVTAVAIGILVDEGKASWDTLVKDVLPYFNSRNKTLQEHATLTDILSHLTGMSRADSLWLGTESNVLISGANGMQFINNQTLLAPFRAQFGYSNLCYELAGHVIEALSRQSYFDFVKSRIIDPLGMSRTFLQTPPADVDNSSICYNTLDDKSTAPIPCAKNRTDRGWLI